MNPYNLIGFFFVIICGTKYANAVPIASDTNVIAENTTSVLNNDGNLDKLLYNAIDINKSTENVRFNQSTTKKPPNEAHKPKIRRRRVNKNRRNPTTERPTKPTKIAILMPNLFISQGWGPGR